MYILSLLPTLFLAVTSFVTAAPTADLADNAVSVQNIIDIMSGATTELTPLNEQLVTATKASPPDAEQLDSVISQVTAIVSSTTEQFQAAVKNTDLTSSNAADLDPSASSFITLLSESLNSLVPGLQGLPIQTASSSITPANNLVTSAKVFYGSVQDSALGDSLNNLLHQLANVVGALGDVVDALVTELGL